MCVCVCVWVQTELREAEFQLVGSESYAARFGETSSDLGDIDDDGDPGELADSW